MIQRSLLFAVFAAIVLSMPLTGARAAAVADIDVEPPSPIYEVSPGTRAGYVWSDGCWLWDGHRHRWHPGFWVAEKPGYVWVSDKWEQRGQKWHFNKAHWEKDGDEAENAPAEQAPANAAASAESSEEAVDPAPADKAPKPVARRRPAPKTSVDYNNTTQWPFYAKH